MKNDYLRMVFWLGAGLALYAASMAIGAVQPQAQVALWKAGNVTTFGFIGYWIARTALGRVDHGGRYVGGDDRIARAILVGCVIIAGGLGL